MVFELDRINSCNCPLDQLDWHPYFIQGGWSFDELKRLGQERVILTQSIDREGGTQTVGSFKPRQQQSVRQRLSVRVGELSIVALRKQEASPFVGQRPQRTVLTLQCSGDVVPKDARQRSKELGECPRGRWNNRLPIQELPTEIVQESNSVMI